jgi:hypothetical protein
MEQCESWLMMETDDGEAFGTAAKTKTRACLAHSSDPDTRISAQALNAQCSARFSERLASLGLPVIGARARRVSMDHEEEMYRLGAFLIFIFFHVDHILVSTPVTFLAMVFCIHRYIHTKPWENTTSHCALDSYLPDPRRASNHNTYNNVATHDSSLQREGHASPHSGNRSGGTLGVLV